MKKFLRNAAIYAESTQRGDANDQSKNYKKSFFSILLYL